MVWAVFQVPTFQGVWAWAGATGVKNQVAFRARAAQGQSTHSTSSRPRHAAGAASGQAGVMAGAGHFLPGAGPGLAETVGRQAGVPAISRIIPAQAARSLPAPCRCPTGGRGGWSPPPGKRGWPRPKGRRRWARGWQWALATPPMTRRLTATMRAISSSLIICRAGPEASPGS